MDAVNHPAHYQLSVDPMTVAVRNAILNDDVDPMNIECFEAMASMLTIEEMRGYLRGNSFKYRWRYRHKGAGIQDVKKAKWYEKKLELLEDAVLKFYEVTPNV